ncbi:TPA: hypothetical protein ACH3X1_002800 [Trebouxia sp. C0004]
MLKGYGNYATQLGYQKKGAVPLTEAEMQLLLQSMNQACNSSSTDPHQQMLLLRDGMLISLLWQSCLRGFNAGALRSDSFVLPTGENAVPYLSARGKAAGWMQASPSPITSLPLGVGAKQFAEKPMTCSNAWACLTKCLKALDMYTG